MDEVMARHLEVIRDRNLPMSSFRYHSDILAEYLIEQLLDKVPMNQRLDIVSILIFRASLVFFPPLVRKCRASSIGLLGLRRDEKTLVAEKYYSNLPKLNDKSIIAIFDPMLGTAGTLGQTVQEATDKFRADTGKTLWSHNIYYTGFLAADSGYRRALMRIPSKNITLLAVDPILDANGYIDPGLGDFGDRYFGV